MHNGLTSFSPGLSEQNRENNVHMSLRNLRLTWAIGNTIGLWMLDSFGQSKQRAGQRHEPLLMWPFLTALLLCLDTFPVGAQFSASLDRDTVIVGEPVTLSLKFENVQPGGVPNLPPLPGLRVAGGWQTRSESRIENGASTTTVIYSLPLIAEKAGDYTIPPMVAEFDGKKVQTQQLQLKVLQSDPSAPPADYANKLAFLWPVLPKKEMYVGEVMVVELRLYLRSEIRKYSELRLPPLRGDGFTGGKTAGGQQFQRRLGAAQFNVIPFYQTVTPVKTGDLALAPINATIVVRIVTGGRRTIFDSGFDPEDPFGPATRPEQVALTVDQQTIHVLPLPQDNMPPGFSGAIGNFQLAYSAGPTNVTAGDPITVRIQISGRGYLDGVAIPPLEWKDFKSFPPTIKTETTDPLGLQGTKYFEQLVTPQSPDLRELPGISFSFFDPDAKAYKTLSEPPIKLTVRPGAAAAAPTVAAARDTNEKPQMNQDIVPIKQHFGSVIANARPLLVRPWFLALQSVPALAFIGALTWRKRNESWANNPRLRRKRMLEHMMRNGLEQMRRSAAANKSEEFFATLFRLLQEQNGERLDLPASAITEAVVEENLRPRGVPEETLQAVQELFQICNLARYAPMRTSQELTAVIPKFENAIAKLKEVP
jgi:hypothetical protein